MNNNYVIDLIDNYITLESIKHNKHNDCENMIYVKDLCFCKEKSILRKKYKHIDLEILKQPQVKLGILLHKAIQSILEYHNFDIEVPGEISIDKYIIKGRIDAIYYIHNKKYGVELKFSENIIEPYFKQVKIYNTMFDLEYTTLISVTERKFFVKEISERYEKETILKFINNWKSPQYDFECKTCYYAQFCNIVKQKRLQI